MILTEREYLLKSWLGEQLRLNGFSIEPASEDASFRRYFRVEAAGTTYIAMDAPPEQESCGPFVDIARRFSLLGLHVPEVIAEDLERGFLLLEDLGSEHYLDALTTSSVDRLYGDALGALATIQACGSTEGLSEYDRCLLLQEMRLFPEWLVQRLLGLELRGPEKEMLNESFDYLVQKALEQPQVCVHRDYHSRNLLVSTAPTPGILDFQDAVLGPVTYDLVSLLRDCYIEWPVDQVQGWAMGYYELAVQSGVLKDEHKHRFLRWFDLMGVQRHLKASGIFARLDRRDAKPGYLQDIPRTLRYIVQVADNYPELRGLGQLVQVKVLPAIRELLAQRN